MVLSRVNILVISCYITNYANYSDLTVSYLWEFSVLAGLNWVDILLQ